MEGKKAVATPTKERTALQDVGQSSPALNSTSEGQNFDETLTPRKRKHESSIQPIREQQQPGTHDTSMIDAQMQGFTKNDKVEAMETEEESFMADGDANLADVVEKKAKEMQPAQLPVTLKKKSATEYDMELEDKTNPVEEAIDHFNKCSSNVDVSFLYDGPRRSNAEALFFHLTKKFENENGINNITCSLLFDNIGIGMDQNFIEEILCQENDDEDGFLLDYENFWQYYVIQAKIDVEDLSQYFHDMIVSNFGDVRYGKIYSTNNVLKVAGISVSRENLNRTKEIIKEKYGIEGNVNSFGCMEFSGDGSVRDITLYKEITKKQTRPHKFAEIPKNLFENNYGQN